MDRFLPQVLRSDCGSHLIEYALLALGLSAALVDPSLVTATCYQVADRMRLLAAQLLSLM